MHQLFASGIGKACIGTVVYKAPHAFPGLGTDSLEQGSFLLRIHGIHVHPLCNQHGHNHGILHHGIVNERSSLLIRSVHLRAEGKEFLDGLEVLALDSIENQFILVFVIKQELLDLRCPRIVHGLFPVGILKAQRNTEFLQQLDPFQEPGSGGEMQRSLSFLVIHIRFYTGLELLHQIDIARRRHVVHDIVQVLVDICNRDVVLHKQQVDSLPLAFLDCHHQGRLALGILRIAIDMGRKQFAHHLDIVVCNGKVHQGVSLFEGVIDTRTLSHQELDSIQVALLHCVCQRGIALAVLGIHMRSLCNIAFHFTLVSGRRNLDKKRVGIHAVRNELLQVLRLHHTDKALAIAIFHLDIGTGLNKRLRHIYRAILGDRKYRSLPLEILYIGIHLERSQVLDALDASVFCRDMHPGLSCRIRIIQVGIGPIGQGGLQAVHIVLFDCFPNLRNLVPRIGKILSRLFGLSIIIQ